MGHGSPSPKHSPRACTSPRASRGTRDAAPRDTLGGVAPLSLTYAGASNPQLLVQISRRTCYLRTRGPAARPPHWPRLGHTRGDPICVRAVCARTSLAPHRAPRISYVSSRCVDPSFVRIRVGPPVCRSHLALRPHYATCDLFILLIEQKLLYSLAARSALHFYFADTPAFGFPYHSFHSACGPSLRLILKGSVNGASLELEAVGLYRSPMV
eukprot:scaffold72895_cov30-Tisochrysis_lutea.AAC.1